VENDKIPENRTPSDAERRRAAEFFDARIRDRRYDHFGSIELWQACLREARRPDR
jgi:hypothetical protein